MIVSKLLIPLLFVLMSFSLSFAKCPVDALNVNVFTGKSLGQKRVYAEIKDKRGINKVELEKIGEGVYHGELSFLTQGFTFFIELSCSYFPKYLTIYFDDNIVEKMRLKKKKLIRHKAKGRFLRFMYEVNVFLEDKPKQK